MRYAFDCCAQFVRLLVCLWYPTSLGDLVDATEVLPSLFVRSAAVEAGRVAAQVYSPSLQREWPQDLRATLVGTLLGRMPAEECKVSAQGLCVASASDPRALTLRGPEVLREVVGLYQGFSKLAMAAAFVTFTFLFGKESCIEQHTLRIDAEAALKFLGDLVQDTLRVLSTERFTKAGALPKLEFQVPAVVAKDWVGVVQASLSGIQHHFVRHLVQDIAVLTDEVSKATPRVDHAVSGNTYNVNLAKNISSVGRRARHSRRSASCCSGL